MTRSITEGKRKRALQVTDPDDAPDSHTLITTCRAFTITAALIGVAAIAAGMAGHEDRVLLLVIGGASALVLAGLGAVVLCIHHMLLTLGDVYRRGYLRGWMSGWRGQPPEDGPEWL